VSGPSDRAVSSSSPGVSPERAPGAAGALPSPDSRSAIDALVTLLGCETKTSNLAIVRSRLLELGAEALPLLDRVRVPGDGGRAAGVAREIRRRLLDAEWDRWASGPDADLETGALLIDRFGDHLSDPAAVRRRLDDLAFELGRRLGRRPTVDAAIPMLRSFLFEEVGLRGNTDAYEDPENSYLSVVLERKLGIPVSLSVVLLLIAKRLRLPIVGIGMPGHFMVRYGARASGPYLDAFGGGKVLTGKECADWLCASGFEFDPRMLQPVGSRYIVARMLRNLIAVFAKRGAASDAETLGRYLKSALASPPSYKPSSGSAAEESGAA
jgi:regulator of sirC expression with transglutaminase-like and TPR domain